ncbi:MAG: hypothetical protein WD794_00655 [Mycobacteriales bacterium]
MSAPENPFDRPAPPAGQPAYGHGSYGQPTYGQGSPPGWGPPPQPGQVSPSGGWQGAPQTEVKAMIALGLAIAAYTPTIPFLGAIAALVLARLARRDILASGGTKTGLDLCTWAVVLAVVHLVLVSLFLLLLFGLFLLPIGLLGL